MRSGFVGKAKPPLVGGGSDAERGGALAPGPRKVCGPAGNYSSASAAAPARLATMQGATIIMRKAAAVKMLCMVLAPCFLLSC